MQSLTGNKDIDLLIINYLSDQDIENFDQCIKLKSDNSFWKQRLKTKYNIISDYNFDNYKNVYFEYARFFEYFQLSMFVALLKEYYCNQFAVYFLLYLSKKTKIQGFFPLLKDILDLISNCNILELEEYLILNKEKVGEIHEKYFQIVESRVDLDFKTDKNKLSEYKFPYKIKFNCDIWKSTLFTYLYFRIIKRDNIFSYKFHIDNNAVLNIKFDIDTTS